MTDNVDIDLTGFKDRVGGRVLPARYRVLVEDAEVDTAKSGNTMINLWLRVVGGEFDGSTIVDRLVLTEKSLFRVVGFMQAIGLPTPKRKLRVNLRQFIGKYLEVDVEDGDPYNGRVKSEVRGYLRISGSTPGDTPADLPVDEEEDTGDAGAAEVTEEDHAAAVATFSGQDDAGGENGGGQKLNQPPEGRVPDRGADVPDEVDLDTLDLG